MAILGEDVADAAGDFAANSDTAVPVLHPTTSNDEVLRRNSNAATIVVSARFNRNAIIARSEGTVLDKHILARFWIATVRIGAGLFGCASLSFDIHAAHRHVSAKYRMKLPHRRVTKRDAFDEHVLRAVGLDELRSQITSLAEDAFSDGRALRNHLVEKSACLVLLGVTFLPAATCATLPGPPVGAIRLTINDAFARQRDVLLLEGINKWRVVHQLHPLPAREDDGQIFLRIAVKLDGRAFADIEVDIALQVNRAGQILAHGHDDTPTARFVARFDGLAKSICAIRLAIAHCAIALNIEVTLRENGRLDTFQNLRRLRPRIIFRISR